MSLRAACIRSTNAAALALAASATSDSASRGTRIAQAPSVTATPGALCRAAAAASAAASTAASASRTLTARHAAHAQSTKTSSGYQELQAQLSALQDSVLQLQAFQAALQLKYPTAVSGTNSLHCAYDQQVLVNSYKSLSRLASNPEHLLLNFIDENTAKPSKETMTIWMHFELKFLQQELARLQKDINRAVRRAKLDYSTGELIANSMSTPPEKDTGIDKAQIEALLKDWSPSFGLLVTLQSKHTELRKLLLEAIEHYNSLPIPSSDIEQTLKSSSINHAMKSLLSSYLTIMEGVASRNKLRTAYTQYQESKCPHSELELKKALVYYTKESSYFKNRELTTGPHHEIEVAALIEEQLDVSIRLLEGFLEKS